MKETAFLKAHHRYSESFDDWTMTHREAFRIEAEDPYQYESAARTISGALIAGAVFGLMLRFGCMNNQLLEIAR